MERGARRAALAAANSERSQRILAMQHTAPNGSASRLSNAPHVFEALETGALPSQRHLGAPHAAATSGHHRSEAAPRPVRGRPRE